MRLTTSHNHHHLLLLFLSSLTTPSLATTTSPKRGLVHIPSNKHPADDQIWTRPGSPITWYYNYHYEPSAGYVSNKDLHFVPMIWGPPSASDSPTGFYDSVKAQIDHGANITHVLTFNEPDESHSTGGSSFKATVAADIWIRQLEPLRKLGVKVGAPAVTGSPRGLGWLDDFFKACKDKVKDGDGCTPDFMPVHWYGAFEGLASHLGQVEEKYPRLKIWVTEWGMIRQGLNATQEYVRTAMEYMDRLDNVTHYAYYGAFRSDVSNVGPNAAMLTQDGKLTDIGSWYLGGASTGNIPSDKSSSAAARSTFGVSWSLMVLVWGVVLGLL